MKLATVLNLEKDMLKHFLDSDTKLVDKELTSRNVFMTCLQIDLVIIFNPLSASPTKWSNTLKQFVSNIEHFGVWHLKRSNNVNSL